MNIKRTLAELVLAASLLLPSCSKVEKETVYVDKWQSPIMNVRAMSEDSHFVGLSFNQGTDVEAFVYDSENGVLSNFSNDSVNSDFPVGFVGGHLITRCTPPDDAFQKMKVYDSSGALKFESEEFDYFFNYFPHSSSKFLIETEKDDENVYVFDVNSMSLEKLVSSAEQSDVRGYSNDCSVVFILSDDDITSSIHMYKSGVLSLVINGDYYVERVSDNGKKAILYNYGLDDMKIFDSDTGMLQNVVLPFNSVMSYVDGISQNGLAAIVRLWDNGADNYYHLDIPTGTWKLVNPTPIDMFPERMSADGSLAVFRCYDDEYEQYLLYNSSTQQLYSPVDLFEYDEFVGFTFDNKVIFEGDFSGQSTEDYVIVSHDPVTKNNTIIADPTSTYLYEYAMLFPNREVLAIAARENATGDNVIVLEDLVAHTNKVIKQQGVDLWLREISFDGKYLFLNSYGPKDNLFVYRTSDGVLKQVTDNPDGDRWFNIFPDLSSDDAVFFEQRYSNGTKEVMSYKFSEDKLTKISN